LKSDRRRTTTTRFEPAGRWLTPTENRGQKGQPAVPTPKLFTEMEVPDAEGSDDDAEQEPDEPEPTDAERTTDGRM
jgi:hypothetical protein